MISGEKNGTNNDVTTKLPNEIWIQIFRMVGSMDSIILCALVCTTWCKLIRDELVTCEGVREIINPLSTTRFLRRVQLDQEWLSPCLKFVSERCQTFAIEELEIQGLTYAHLPQLKNFLQTTIISTSLRRIVFYNAFLPLEKYTPVVFNTFPNLTEFTVAFPDGKIFKRRSEANAVTLKAVDLQRLWLRLRDDGFEIATNKNIVFKLIENSPHLKQLFLESIATRAHEIILQKFISGEIPELRVFGMTHDARIQSLLSHPIVKEVNQEIDLDHNNKDKKTVIHRLQKKKKGLRVLALTEDYIRYHYYDYVSIHRSIIRGAQDTLELLYLESLYPSSHVTWPELLGGYDNDNDTRNYIKNITSKKNFGLKCPNLRQLVMHLGKTCQYRSVLPACISEKDFEGQLCILLSNAPRLEKFTYRRDLDPTSYIRKSTWVTDRLLETLMKRCPKLTTFEVAGGYQFTWRPVRQFIRTFQDQLTTVEFDCTIGTNELEWMVKSLSRLKKLSIRHICKPQLNNFDDCPHIKGHGGQEILSAWGSSFEITNMDRLDQTLYDIS
ncbi:hypothetical protein BDA99DRAFT_557798 [Phascolomyces articulosus]|uniref:F-box domain-containing protein n=1 Tax=Phascolomyces articulosus TaxID=60185 RepID=A0AAD5PG48_9FUNG|nr:hypothetical protein BDA99DRAFT_557798 [Phascolomyces articulosus]